MLIADWNFVRPFVRRLLSTETLRPRAIPFGERLKIRGSRSIAFEVLATFLTQLRRPTGCLRFVRRILATTARLGPVTTLESRGGATSPASARGHSVGPAAGGNSGFSVPATSRRKSER